MEIWGGNQAVDTALDMPGLNTFVFSRPHKGDQAGGDIHYLSSCASGRITRLLVADVSGHGQTASDTALKLRGLMRRHINNPDQSRFVSEVNREFSGLAQAGGFATAVMGTFWAPSATLSLSNAGHPRPLFYSAANRRWSALTQSDGDAKQLSNIPLGVTDEVAYSQASTRMAVGDMVLLYTDSLIESADTTGRMLGETGLLERFNDLKANTPADVIPATVAAWERAGQLQEDDVTALLIHANGSEADSSPWAYLKAGARILRGAFSPA